jgi:hypothetical protein
MQMRYVFDTRILFSIRNPRQCVKRHYESNLDLVSCRMFFLLLRDIFFVDVGLLIFVPLIRVFAGPPEDLQSVQCSTFNEKSATSGRKACIKNDASGMSF